MFLKDVHTEKTVEKVGQTFSISYGVLFFIN